MTTVTRDEVRIPISEEPENLAWLYKIIEVTEPRITSKPLIQKVAQTLRRVRRNKTCFDPSVVSFGPYHYGKDHLKRMERYKEVAALWFISLGAGDRENAITKEEAKRVYDEFVEKAPRVSFLRKCYNIDKFVDTIKDADFMRMMFLDGCFMLYFIQLFRDRSGDLLETSHLNRPLILRDMFLLENQIPYSVLVALKSLKPSLMPGSRDDWVASFFKTVFLPSPSSVASISLRMLSLLFLIYTVFPVVLVFSIICLIVCIPCMLVSICCPDSGDSTHSSSEEVTGNVTEAGPEPEPLHLLDLLHSTFVHSTHSSSEDVTENQTETECLHLRVSLLSILTKKGVDLCVHGAPKPTISELKASGIQVRVSNTESLSLNNIKLKKGWIDSYLELPRIIIDDSTKTHLLNLAAYEMCPDGSLGQPVITSYICFLNSLISNADDVKELRSSNIMLNRLGSDEKVVNLFRELAANLSPDFNAYSNVTHGMKLHSRRCFNRTRVWIGQFLRVYFSSPWTAVSSTAASTIIILTLVQTVYSVLSYYKSK